MRARQSFWILGASLLTACSSQPLELPTCEIPAPMAAVGHPISVPEMPVEVSRDGGLTSFDHEGIVRLTQVRVSAETNKTIAQENALAIEARNEEVNQLIECARYQKIWMEVREDMLEQERQNHMMDNLWHRGIIVVGVLAAVL